LKFKFEVSTSRFLSLKTPLSDFLLSQFAVSTTLKFEDSQLSQFAVSSMKTQS